MIKAYTDGACLGNKKNSGYGGWAYMMTYGERTTEHKGSLPGTTNNAMELMAIAEALEHIKPRKKEEEKWDVTIYTDSQYSIDIITTWRKETTHKERPNMQLIERCAKAAERHNVTFVKIKGHSGIAENEHVDHLASVAAALERDKEEVKFELLRS